MWSVGNILEHKKFKIMGHQLSNHFMLGSKIPPAGNFNHKVHH